MPKGRVWIRREEKGREEHEWKVEVRFGLVTCCGIPLLTCILGGIFLGVTVVYRVVRCIHREWISCGPKEEKECELAEYVRLCGHRKEGVVGLRISTLASLVPCVSSNFSHRGLF